MTTKDNICSHVQLSEQAVIKIRELELGLPCDRDLAAPSSLGILLHGLVPPSAPLSTLPNTHRGLHNTLGRYRPRKVLAIWA